MTEAMPFLQKAILLSYDPRPFVAAFLLHHSLRDGLALRASARVRLAGTGR